MFFLLAVVLAAAGFAHGAIGRSPLTRRIELALVYLLAGYFGLLMVGIALYLLIAPDRASPAFGVEGAGMFQQFTAWAFLGMAAASLLTVRLRGAYLVGPIVAWSLDYFGATYVHLAKYSAAGHLSTRFAALIVLEHAGPPLLAIALGLWLWRRRSRARPLESPASTSA